MVCQSRHSSNSRALLSTTGGATRNEDTSVLAPVSTLSPLASSGVPERLPLSGEVAVTGWNTEEEGVIFFELGGVDDRDVGGLGGCVHLREDFFGESLCDSGRVVRLWVGEQEVELRTGRGRLRCQPL